MKVPMTVPRIPDKQRKHTLKRSITSGIRLRAPRRSAQTPLQIMTITPVNEAIAMIPPDKLAGASSDSSKYETVHEYKGCDPPINRNAAIPNQ